MVGRVRIMRVSDQDRIVLQRMIDREKRNVVNTRQRARSENSFVDNVDAQSTDHYIAYVEDTIPGLVGESLGTGSGTGSAPGPSGAIPGNALCPIYKVINNVLRPAGFRRRVYNLTSSDISATWITVTKDKFGTWIANLAGGATILVKITQTAPGTGSFGTGTGLGDPLAIYRTAADALAGFDVIALNEDHEEEGSAFTCYADELVNVHYTDSLVRIQRFGSKWQIVTTGENHWKDAFTFDKVDVDGSGMVQMFDHGPTVPATSGMPIGQFVFCQLLFDSQAQEFYIGNQGCETSNVGTGTL